MIKSIEIEVRFFDIDMNNHVNNSVYFTYMENARTELLMEDFLAYKEHGILFVVAEASCKYKKPIRLNDNVIAELHFDFSGALHFNVVYYFRNEHGLMYAEGITKLAMIDEKTNRPIRIPQALINKYTS